MSQAHEINEIPLVSSESATTPTAAVVDPEWLSKVFATKKEDTENPLVVQSGELLLGGEGLEGGKVGTMRQLRIQQHVLEDRSCQQTYITKTKHTAHMPDLAREANFYNELAHPFLGTIVPNCWYARGDRTTGRMLLVLEDLSPPHGTITGHLVGSAHPYTWKLKDTVERLTAQGPGPERVIRQTFLTAAEIHAHYWKDESLQTLDWIKGRKCDSTKDLWESQMKYSQSLWQSQREGVEGISLDPVLVSIMDASMSKINWDVYQKDRETIPYTLIQNDFHPFNAIWVPADDGGNGEDNNSHNKEKGRIVLVDWEMVSIGSPGQDLGQYMMNIHPDIRRNCERTVVAAYCEKMKGQYGIDIGNDDIWSEYVMGGACKWIWLLPILIAMCPKHEAQWFADQMTEFFKDHDISKETVQQPRC